VAEALVQRREDAADPNQPTLVWYGLIPLAEWAPNRLAELATLTTLPTTRRFIARRLAEEMQREVAPVEALLAHGVTFEVQPGWVEDILRGIADGTRGWLRAPKSRGWEAFSTRWGLEGSPAVKSLLGELSVLFGEGRAVADLVALIRDNRAETSVRRSALATLVATRPPELRSVCESVIGVRSLSATAAVGLALFDDDAAAAKLAGAYRQVPAADRNVVIGVLVSRVRLARQLIAEVRAGRIPKADVSAFHLRAMKALGDSALHTAVAEIWGQLRDSPAELAAEITRLKQALTPGILASARLGEGRRHFDQLCGACHQLFGVGGRIGPDLTGASRDNVDYLLQNIVDPSAAVTPDFQLQIVTLTDGRVITGFIRVRTPNTLTIQTMTGEVTVEQASIRNVVGTQTSLMPAGLLQALSLDQVRDLFAYLMSPTQVALP
jgi:putative heme-binding domain-containing protein